MSFPFILRMYERISVGRKSDWANKVKCTVATLDSTFVYLDYEFAWNCTPFFRYNPQPQS